MRFWNYFILFLIAGLVLTPLTSAAVINPNTNRGIDLCWIPGVGWILNSCDKAGGGSQGPMGPAGIGNTTNFYNGSYNQSLIFSNLTNIWNLTVENNLTVYSDYVTFVNITISEMNQTPNMTAGPPGADGSNGINGLDNMTANMTAGPQGIQGVNGTPGEEGIQGDKGDKGDKGGQGDKGDQGLQGDKGDKGDRGIQGINGTPGWQGDKGDQGDQGLQGIQGEQGIQGIQGETGPMNQTFNLTINMTGNMTMNQTMLDETAYYWVNATRSLTGTQIFRSVNNSFLYLNGGSGSGTGGLLPGSGALIALYGNTAGGGAAGYTRFYAPNAAGTAWNIVAYITGVTDTPYLDLNSHQIKNILDPSAAQDATTLNFVELVNTTERNNITANNVSIKSYVDAKQKCGATANVADGGTITHGFGTTPTYALVTGTNTSQTEHVTTLGAVTFTVGIKKSSTLAVGKADTIYWCVG
jgi:hypothetical protein